MNIEQILMELKAEIASIRTLLIGIDEKNGMRGDINSLRKSFNDYMATRSTTCFFHQWQSEQDETEKKHERRRASAIGPVALVFSGLASIGSVITLVTKLLGVW